MHRIAFLLLLTSCSHYISSLQDEKRQANIALDEMRIELADVKHTLKGYQVELNILEEKLKNQTAAKPDAKLKDVSGQLAALERKVAQLEKVQEKALADLRGLSGHANQTSSAFEQVRKKLFDIEQEIATQSHRLDEVGKLKGTLTSISKAMAQKPSSKTHRVKPGETLEKIARLEGTSVDALKKLNHLQHDRIFVGQEIKLPDEETP